jgi:hypothetical protein
MVSIELEKVMGAAIGGLQTWRGVLVATKNGGTCSSYVSGVGDLQVQPWEEGVATKVGCIFGGATRVPSCYFQGAQGLTFIGCV